MSFYLSNKEAAFLICLTCSPEEHCLECLYCSWRDALHICFNYHSNDDTYICTTHPIEERRRERKKNNYKIYTLFHISTCSTSINGSNECTDNQNTSTTTLVLILIRFFITGVVTLVTGPCF